LLASGRGDPGSIPGQTMWDLWWKKITLEKVSFRVLRVSLVGIIAPMPLTDLLLHVVFTERTNGQSLETFQKASSFGNQGVLEREVSTSNFFEYSGSSFSLQTKQRQFS